MKLRRHSLYIVGAGGHGLVVAEAAALGGNCNDIAFFDDDFPARTVCGEWPVMGNIETLLQALREARADRPDVVVAIGRNATRAQMMARLEEAGAQFATIVHPRAYLSPTATVETGSVVLAGAILNSRARIGSGSIVNVACVVDHDTQIGPFTHLAPGVIVAGGCTVGAGAWLGTGARLAPGHHIVAGTVLPAGTIVG